MTISVSEIATKLLARIEADTGSGGLFNSSNPLVREAVWEQAPQSTLNPYLVFDVTLVGSGQQAGEAFKVNAVEVEVEVIAVVSRREAGVNAMDRLSQILARLYGDSGTNGTPTYGLHRWKMTGLTGWEASLMRFEAQQSQSDDDHVAVNTRFRIPTVNQSW